MLEGMNWRVQITVDKQNDLAIEWLRSLPAGVVSHYIISAVSRCFVSQMKMKAIVLTEMLRETLEAKINKTRREIRDTYIPIEVDRLEAQILAYQWVQARLQDLVINNNEDKETRIRI
jgi:hypothetical protein